MHISTEASIFLIIIIWLLAVVLSFLVTLVISLIIYARWNYGTLEALGIPVVKPHWLLGSDYNSHNTLLHLEDLQRYKKYGPVFGVYSGRTPQVYICDPELLQLILVKDFEHFRNHKKFSPHHPVTDEILDFLDDDKWKTVRFALAPMFTTGKIKEMCVTISEIADEYVTSLLAEMKGDHIKMDFRDYLSPLVLEVIGNCFCGMKIEKARDPKNKFVKALKVAMGADTVRFGWTYTLASVFPFISNVFSAVPNEAVTLFESTMEGILDGREKSGIQKADMVNTLLELRKKSQTEEYGKLNITPTTVIAQGFEFFLASYDTVRTQLSFLVYHLATYPEIQQKLLQEIDLVLKKHNGQVSHEFVADCHYLNACLSETFRYTTGFFRADRLCTQDWQHNGVKIKKGMTVIIPLWALHRNPQLYPLPEHFNPERFMPENKDKIDPFAFASFGHGPRACMGQRFAYETLKIIMARFLVDFQIRKRGDTVFKTVPGNPFFVQYEPILVDFMKRNVK